jgi:starch synthase
MHLLFAASELYPLAKTGGLGDVMGALPAAVKARGHSVSCVLPFFRSVHERGLEIRDTGMEFQVPLGERGFRARLYETLAPNGVKVFLVRRDEYFDRSGLYVSDLGDYDDNAERYIFFSKAVVELARRLRPEVDVIHVNDWTVGLVPAFVRAAGYPFRTVFTIHNLAYQGSFPGTDADLCGLPSSFFTPDGFEFYGRLNCMKAGIVYADQVTTVSPTYAREIQTAEFGCGLDPVLRAHAAKLTGVLNGIDEALWDPATDAHLPRRYTAARPAGKAACRKALLKDAGWEPGAPELVVGMISRLVVQKGFDVVQAAWPELRELPVRWVVLGNGDAALEDWFRATAAAEPDRMHATIGFDEKRAHRIEAGADAFLMPSRYEPCGLNQMYSQRYGTLPIVHATGGLRDSVEDWVELGGPGTGFQFEPCEPGALVAAIRRALKFHADNGAWISARRRAMERSFAWDRSAAEYEAVYQRAVADGTGHP